MRNEQKSLAIPTVYSVSPTMDIKETRMTKSVTLFWSCKILLKTD